MQQLDIPIITKTYELYRALHDLQKGIPKMERYSFWSRDVTVGTALRCNEALAALSLPKVNRKVADR